MATGRCYATCHVVTPSGSGANSGADWNNADAGLPATLTRGDTYYLADGSYGSYSVNTPGSTMVTIKKAIAPDHCTDTGWNAGTMGSSQAIFTGIKFSGNGTANNVTFDGNSAATTQGCGTITGAAASDCGIMVDNSSCSGGTDACDSPILIGTVPNPGVAGVLLQGMEWKGNGSNLSEKNFNYTIQGSTFTANHIYGHDTGCVYIQQYGGSRTVKNSYFWKNKSGSDCHGQYAYNGSSVSSVTEFNNVYRDFNGTAIYWFDATTSSNLAFYNNLYWESTSPPLPTGTGNGILACGNGAACSNVTFVQNTVVNQQGSYDCGLQLAGLGGSTCTNCIAENNIWYTNQNENISLGGLATEDYNTFINNVGVNSNPGSGAHDVYVASAGPNPFVNWLSGNFHLASVNTNWTGGVTLSLPFNVDADGFTRGAGGIWARGAYQFNGSSSSGPNPPTNLTVVPH